MYKEILKKYWFNILMLLLAITGIVFAYFVYAQSLKEREPVYLVTSNIPVFQRPEGKASEYLSIIKKSDGTVVTDSVFSLEFAFWNRGRLSIKKENILSKLKLVFGSEVKIIDYYLSDASRYQIINPKVSLDSNVLEFNFDILEKNDGVKITVLYHAEQKVNLKFEGAIEGVAKILGKEDLHKDNLIKSIFKPLLRGAVIIIFMLFFFFFFEIFSQIFKRVTKGKYEKINKFLDVLSPIATLLIFLALASLVFYGVVSRQLDQENANSIPTFKTVDPNKD